MLGNHPGAFTARIATKIGQSMINAKGGNGSLKTVKDGQAYDPCVVGVTPIWLFTDILQAPHLKSFPLSC